MLNHLGAFSNITLQRCCSLWCIFLNCDGAFQCNCSALSSDSNPKAYECPKHARLLQSNDTLHPSRLFCSGFLSQKKKTPCDMLQKKASHIQFILLLYFISLYAFSFLHNFLIISDSCQKSCSLDYVWIKRHPHALLCHQSLCGIGAKCVDFRFRKSRKLK